MSDATLKSSRSKLTTPVIITFFFALLFVSISFPNHFLFRSAALDLGLYTNALYDYAHFNFNDSSVFKDYPENLLADHFDIMLMIISPLSWIFGSITLLIVQVIAVLAGGWGVYRYLEFRKMDPVLCVTGMTVFYISFSVISALSFDFHSKVIAASLVPWLFVQIEKRNFFKCTLLFVAIIICQENMALWMVFVLCGAAIKYRRLPVAKLLFTLSIVSGIYFYVVTKMVMPGLSVNNSFGQFKYSILGNDYAESIKTMLTHPLKILKALFVNTTNDPMGDNVKSECWLFFLFSGGVLLILRPLWLFMLIPIFLQKFLHNQIQMWGVHGQYAIEFAPIIALGVFDFIDGMKNKKMQLYVAVVTLIFGFGATIHLMDKTHDLLPKDKVRIYQAAHWKSDINTHSARQAIELIPTDAKVSAQTNLVPHLSWRDRCYAFPIIKDAGYVLYIKAGNPYPLSNEEYEQLTRNLEMDTMSWKMIYSSDSIRVLRRIKTE